MTYNRAYRVDTRVLTKNPKLICSAFDSPRLNTKSEQCSHEQLMTFKRVDENSCGGNFCMIPMRKVGEGHL